jgi:hypothetical protein
MHQSKSTHVINALSLGSNFLHTLAASTKLSTPRMLRMRDRSKLNSWYPRACNQRACVTPGQPPPRRQS